MRSAGDRRERRARQRRGKRLRAASGTSVSRVAGDDERRRFDSMQRSSQIGGCEQRERRGERLRRRLAAREQLFAQRRERAPAVVAALHLQRQEAQQRQPYATPQLVAEPRERRGAIARGQPSRATNDGVVATSTSRRDALRPRRAPSAARRARRATSRAPSSGCRSQPNASSSASAMRCEHRRRRSAPTSRGRAGRRRARDSAGRAPATAARTARRASPKPCSSTSGGPLPADSTCRCAARAFTRNSGAMSRERTPQRVDVGERVRGRQRHAQPRGACRHGRRTDRRHPDAARKQARRRARARSASSPTISGWIGVGDAEQRPRQAGRAFAECAMSAARCARREVVVADRSQAQRRSATASSGGAAVV